jgi:hypothetical protein
VLFAPRFTLDANVSAADRWFLHAKARADRGFDPGDQPDGEVRLDELSLRWRISDAPRLDFQIGKYATVFGAWPAQSDFFDDPFLLAPLPYSQIIGINPRSPAAMTPGAITARNYGLAPAFSTLPKENWTSMIWGQDYATGAGVSGSTEHLDYAVEIKNNGLSAHPDSWSEINFSDPALTARLGYRPDASWAFGVSASRGTWMEKEASPLLPGGVDRGDFMRNSVGIDARWAHHDLIVSGEVIASEYETPDAGDLRAVSWYLQTRWKASPGVWLAARFGQTLANEADIPGGTDATWQPDVWRAEIGAGWRVSPDVLIKAGYSFTHADGDPEAGEHLLGTGIGWRF